MSNDKMQSRFSSLIFTIIGILLMGMVVSFIFVDEPVFSWLRQNPRRFHHIILERAFEQLGKVFAIVWLLLFWVWITGRHKTVITGLLALIITIPAVWSVKAAVKRPRPSNVIKAEAGIESRPLQTDNWSFPSGDTASVCAIGTVLAMVARRPGKIAMIICCAGVGVLRVLDLAHYPSDVLGGAALGIFCGWAAVRMRKRSPKIENIFGGAEQFLSFVGIFSIPVLVWLFQGRDKLDILLMFYTPVAILISLIAWRLNRGEKIEQVFSDRMIKQGNWFFRWRNFLPLIILPLFLIELRYFTYPGNDHTLDRLWEIFCFTIALTGLGVRIFTIGYAPRETLGKTTSEPGAAQLNTTGMYSIVRHPLHLGNFITWMGIILFPHSAALAAFCAIAFFLLYESVIYSEEAFLADKFGDAFTDWAKKTPMILPGFKLWRKPAHPFSWQAVLTREYSGFFAIITSFTAIEIFGDRFYEGKWEFDPMWVVIFCTGLLVFLTLRTLKKLQIIKYP